MLAGLWPKRLADAWLALAEQGGKPGLAALRLADAPDKTLRGLAQDIHQWTLTPSGTAGCTRRPRSCARRRGYARAGPEVHAGAHRARLYFIGEAVDVTGWLGGYNFQWAWASGVACGKAL